MSVTFALFVVLFILMIALGGGRGSKSFFTLIFNLIVLFIMLRLMTYGFEPLKVTIIGCIIISSITLFYINGINKKTIASLISVILVVLATILLIFKMAAEAKIQGFGKEQAEEVTYMSLYIHLDFSKIVTSVIIIALLGAIIDVSISISSSMNELFLIDNTITKKSLIKSGMNIGKDILGTMTNTLLFAYIAGFMTLILWFGVYNYTILEVINSKVFCEEIFQIISSGIGIILIIPVTAIITSMILFVKTTVDKQKLKGETKTPIKQS